MLTDVEIARYAQAAGFEGFDLQIAVAVALAESGGNPKAHNKVSPDNSYGLWQINMLGRLGAPRRKQFGIKKNDELFDPAVNAKAAFLVYRDDADRSWRPWSTYTHETYLRFMDRAKAAVATLDGAYVLKRTLRDRRPMMRGEDVERVQKIVGATPDGWYGPITASKVRTYQSRNRLTVDGIVGPNTAKSFGWVFTG